jgi:outer membrane protein assembly factor BamA
LLGDAGFLQASVEPRVNRQARAVQIDWQVQLGAQRRAGPLFVRGNFHTAERTIRNWMLLRPGKLVTTTDSERSQRNLALIQLFNNASPLSFPPELQAGDTYPMLVEVEERHDHWGVARAGVGVSTEQREPGDTFLPVYGTVGYEHRNLLGQGWLFTSRGEYGSLKTEVSAQFMDPRFLGTQFRLQLTGFYSRETTARLGDIRQGSATIGFARELYPGLDASLTYGWRRIIRTEFLLRGAGPDEEQETVSIPTTVGSLRFAVEWQRLDNPLVPTRGLKLQGAVELATPALSLRVGEDWFVKTTLRELTVVPLTDRLGLRHSLRYDHGFALAGASLLPKVERFFAGGDTTIRGFDLDRARVETLTGDLGTLTAIVQHRPLGGSMRVLHNLDLQFRIAGAWHASVFVDSGVVADAFDGLRPVDFRHGAGIAPLVFKLPIGDISIAYAWPLDPEPGDPKYGRLHLNVGLLF